MIFLKYVLLPVLLIMLAIITIMMMYLFWFKLIPDVYRAIRNYIKYGKDFNNDY